MVTDTFNGLLGYVRYESTYQSVTITLFKHNDDYASFINGEVFPVTAAISAIDMNGTVLEKKEFIELAKYRQVQLSQYQNQDSHNGESFLLA